MRIDFLLKGLIIGFSIAAPVGPIGLLCIRRTLTEGRTQGLLSGLGAASADAAYGFVAAFGLTFISNFLVAQQIWLRLAGGVFLCLLGFRTFRARVAQRDRDVKASGPLGAYSSTLFLTLTNPMTIVSFSAIFAGLGIGSGGDDYLSAGLMVAGVFLGSGLWWLILSSGVNRFRAGLGPDSLRWVNRASGMIIGAFGLIALLSLLRG